MKIREITKQQYDEVMAQNLYGFCPLDMRYKFGLNNRKCFAVFVEKFDGRYFVRWFENDKCRNM